MSSNGQATTRTDPAGADAVDALLELEDLSVGFGSERVLRRVSFEVRRGEILALVGESGCGKTLTALAVLGLLPPGAAVLEGRVRLEGTGDLLTLSEPRRREIRGRRLAMIFQEPMSALNPVLSIGFQICESLRSGRRLSRAASRRRALELLEMVAMPDPERRLSSYPHQLSGGQLQRATIAMALAAGPDLLRADEPTTALDVTVQAQVLELLLELRRTLGLTVVLITHDLGVVAQCCDRAIVMYAGQVVERAPVELLFRRPAHPYTRALLAAVPRLDGRPASWEGIPGRVPEPGSLPSGCAFHPRCGDAMAACRRAEPELLAVDAGRAAPRAARPAAVRHAARCFLLEASAAGEGGGSEGR